MKLIFLLIIAVLLALFKLLIPSIKGRIGEAKVSTILSFLPENEYRVINNALLKTPKGSVQIDHIVVSVYGIFVIETKNFKGWITGYERSAKWTKNMYGQKYEFYNPIKQNHSHIIALKNILGFNESKFISIIAFSSNSDLMVETTTPVVYMININSEIKSYTEHKFKASELDGIVAKIISVNLDSPKARKEHVRNIKTNIYTMNSCIENGICPRCKGKLVDRKGKYGSFLGCSNYPNCKFTRPN